MHGAEGIVEVGAKFCPSAATSPSTFSSSGPTSGTGIAGCAICQRIISIKQKPKNKKAQRGDAVLDADDLVVGGKDVCAPEARIFVMLCMDSGMWNCVLPACRVCSSIFRPSD